jgi:hypothetical protein
MIVEGKTAIAVLPFIFVKYIGGFISRFAYRNMNYLSFVSVNKNLKKRLPLKNKGAIFISVAASYLVSNKENEKNLLTSGFEPDNI